MGIEANVEQGLKTAFEAYTDKLAPADAVAYRCFFLDDEAESQKPAEDREYPFIGITASPSVPVIHKSAFQDVPVMLKFATHRQDDKKRATLRAIYEACRAIVDAETTIAVSGKSLIGARIEGGGESDVNDNEQYITLPITVKLCG